ncbi:YlbL family protein [Ornithinimicrobium cryptoxanthini]|uniref:endopeptidase La n=1 Tax=Ornithinimicrobium cryptoxanthini TaxID=2934161 RepID=A0ABY4YKC3_9MICO|nr:PDZ domain-containing protein [Ornithinimicrobium cryptoxanthini]USQ77144.1 PDZ domain-containing protein [Ornithinimicrobium cryptoxanthini]
MSYFGGPPAGQHPPNPPHTRIGWTTGLLLALAVLLVLGVALMNIVTVDKVIYRPAGVHDTLGEINGAPVVHVEGLETFETSGSLDFLTILIDGGPRSDVTAWDWLLAELNPATTVYETDQVYPPDVTAEQIQDENVEMMQRSQNGAAVVALRAFGVEVPQDVKVAQIVKGAPAADTLEVDDQILTVDGTPIAEPDEVREVLQTFEPGDVVPFSVLRAGEELSLKVPTGESDPDPAEPDAPARTVIGVFLLGDYELPYEVTIDAGNVGGPSAGMMFALAIYDKITPGPLTGGLNIAGTGTINSDGQVGGIGGIHQKMYAAERAGVDYFLAPAENCDAVVGNIPDGLQVAKVETFEQAKDLVEALGEGEDVPLPQCG